MDVDVPTPEPLRIRKAQSLAVPLQPVSAEARPRPAFIRHTEAVNDCENQLIHNDGLSQYSTPSATSATIQARWESSDNPVKPCALDRKKENIKMTRNGQHFFSRGSKLLSRIATSIEGIKDRNFTVGSSKSRMLNDSSSLRSMTRALSGFGREIYPSSAQEVSTFPGHSRISVAERIGATDPHQNSISTLNLRKLRSKQKQQVATAVPLTYADISLKDHHLMPLTGANRLIRVAVDVAATLSNTIRRPQHLGANAALDVVVLVDTTSVFGNKLVEVQADTTCGPESVTQSAQILLDVISAIYTSLVPYYDRFSLFTIGNDENLGVRCLLPLDSTHSTRKITACAKSIRLSASDISGRLDISCAIVDISQSVSSSLRRNALAQMFVVTDKPELAMRPLERSGNFRIHTVSQHPSCKATPVGCLNGLHIGFNPRLNGCREDLRRKVKDTIDCIRTNLDGGVLHSLSAQFNALNSCIVDNIVGNSYCQRLRAGERWPMTVYIRIPRSFKLSASTLNCSLLIHEEPQPEIEDPALQSSDGFALINLSLRYKHSHLPDSASVTTSVICQLNNKPYVPPVTI